MKSKISCGIDAFYELTFDAGLPFHIRRTNMLVEQGITAKKADGEKGALQINKFINCKDETVDIEKALRAEAAANVRKDKTFNDFLGTYEGEIERKPTDPNPRVANRPETVPFNPNKKRPVIKKAENPYEEEEKAEYMRLLQEKAPALADNLRMSLESHKSKVSVHTSKSKGSEKKANLIQKKSTTPVLDSDGADEKPKEKDSFPAECNLEFSVKHIIHALEDDFKIVVHPFPQISGELMVLQPDNINENTFWYQDHSLIKRKQFVSLMAKPGASNFGGGMNKEQHRQDVTQTKLKTTEISIDNPLSTVDWINFTYAIMETKGFGWIQLLPEN